MSVELTYRKIGDACDRPPLVILHGLLGSAGNWRTIARQLEHDRTIYCVNLRNHGDSPHVPSMTYEEMAGDIAEFIRQHKLEAPDILGHSMGGKVAMVLALQHPDLIGALVVVDIAPVTYTNRFDMFDAMRSVDLGSVVRRDDAEKQMQESLNNATLRSFVLTNLRRGPDGYQWRVNVEAVEQCLADIMGFPEYGALAYPYPCLFLGGSTSNYLKGHDASIDSHFPKADVTFIEGAGHWPHADNPAETVRRLHAFLNEPRGGA